MGESGSHKRIPVVWLATILLVTAVVCVAADGKSEKDGASDSVQSMCSGTKYKKTCEKALAHVNSSDPKEMVKAGIDAAVINVGQILKNTTLFQKAAKDPSTKAALDVCSRVLGRAITDLKKSIDKVQNFEAAKAKDYIEDLRSWLSAVITYQGTCIDAFDNTTNSDTAKKMKELMLSARHLTANGLSMATDISNILTTLGLDSLANFRLLVEKSEGEQDFFGKRKLLDANVTPNVVVAQDGSGKFKTISEAVATVPPNNTTPFIIYVKAGTYKENVDIPIAATHTILVGDGPDKTIISGSKNMAAGVKTYDTCTLCVEGADFIAKDIGIENTAGTEGFQAVALRSSSERSIYHNVNINGNQDTLYSHTYRQFYSACTISGTIDFVFGDAQALYQNCLFLIRKPSEHQSCAVTAQGREEDKGFGAIIIQNGTINATQDFLTTQPPVQAFLGRPWKKFSRTIIMQTNIGSCIDPAGWTEWMGKFGQDTCYYGEFQNRGPGSDTSKRVTWKGIQKMTADSAAEWTGGVVFSGDDWIKSSGVPYVPGMMDIK